MKKTVPFLLILLSGFFVSCSNSSSPNNNTNKTDSSTLFKKVSGTVSLSAKITGSKSTSLGAEDLNKSEDATVNLSFDLPSNPITNSPNGGSNSAWGQGTTYGGLVNWTEILLTTYDCTGGRATDKETTIKSFSSAASGKQPGGVQLLIKSDGSYTIGVVPGYTGTPTDITHTIETNCGTPTKNTNTGSAPGIPFQQDFIPLTNGANGSVSGTINTSDQSHITGSYTGTDNINLFSIGTTPINLDYQYTISWDLTRTP